MLKIKKKKVKKTKRCKECNKRITKYEYYKNDGLCDSCDKMLDCWRY